MSIECGECESDLRGGHADNCSKSPVYALKCLTTSIEFLSRTLHIKSPWVHDKEKEFGVVIATLLEMRREWEERERFLRRPDAD